MKHNVRDKKIIKSSEEHDVSHKFSWLNQVYSYLFYLKFFVNFALQR